MSIEAAIVVIGNEILSGRTEDKNVNFIAKKLSEIGIVLREVRIIPDVRSTIISTIRHLSSVYDYVFTTGGIGPTHDDITSEAVGEAFGLRIVCNEEAHKILLNHYRNLGRELNEASKKMAYIPENAELIENTVSGAPGFIVNNVYVMAGVPNIMQAMMLSIIPKLKHGKIVETRALDLLVGESLLAIEFEKLQQKYPMVEMGSYPFVTSNGEHATSLVLRSDDLDAIEKSYLELQTIFSHFPSAGSSLRS